MVRRLGLVVAVVVATTALAAAETPEQRQACTDDAFQHCSHAIPDRDRVFSCLIEKRTQISPLCVAGLAPYLPPEPAPAPVAARKPGKAAAKPGVKPTAKPAAKPATKPAARTAAKQPPNKPLKLTPTGR